MNSLTTSEKCLFSGLPAEISSIKQDDGRMFQVYSGNETCRYYVDGQLLADLRQQFNKNPIDPVTATKVMNKIISLNDEKLIPCFVFDKKYDSSSWMNSEKYIPLEYHQLIKVGISHKNKEQNILNLVAKKLKNLPPFELIGFSQLDMYRLNVTSIEELLSWVLSLAKKSLINHDINSIDSTPVFERDKFIGLTSEGWNSVYQINSQDSGKNVFIAMAFTDENKNPVNPQIREAIKDTCRKLDWEPLIVDEQEHNEGIVDKIISLINDARFVIADLTHHKHGVYYEAGYAKAHGIPVIHSVKSDHLDKVHFDLRHLNLIVWENEDDLREKLTNRILATIKIN